MEIGREHESEKIKNSANKLELAKTVRMMERLHAEEIFATPEMSKQFLDSLSFDDFVRWTDFVSGIETGTEIKYREIGSDSFVELHSNARNTDRCGYLPPKEEYRVPLLKEAFEKAQRIEDPKVAGLTLSFAINAIHPYNDGNGRTGRVIYSLLSHGYSGSDEDNKYFSEMLNNFTGRKVVNSNSKDAGLDKAIIDELYNRAVDANGYQDGPLITRVAGAYRYDNGKWVDYGDEAPKYLAISKDLSEEDRRHLHYVLQEERFAMLPILSTFSSERLLPYTPKTRMAEFDDGTTYVDGKKFLLSLTSEEINNLYNKAIALKNEFVEQIINFSDRPDANDYISKFN